MDRKLEEYCEIIQHSHPVLRYCERFDQNSSKWNFSRHSHPYIEMIYFLEGKAGLDVEGTRLNASMYDTLVYPAACEHQDGMNFEMDCEIICFWVDIPELVLDGPILMHERNRNVRDLFLFIYEEQHRENPLPYLIENAIRMLLMSVLRDRSEIPDIEQFLNQIIPFIDRHYEKRITLEELARRVHISKSYLTRRFRQYTGTTIITYINKRRVEAAKALLIESEETTAEIAYRVGFESPKYFHRVFKKEVGISPAGFRKVYKHNH